MSSQGNSSVSNLLVRGRYRSDPTDAVRLVGTVAGILTVGAGVIHISAAGDHTSLPVMFAGFMIVAALQVVAGGLLVSRRPSKLLIAGVLCLTLVSIGAWLLSRTAGLPLVAGGHKEPIGFKDGVTKLFELGSIPALLLLLSPDLARVSLPSRRLSSHTLAVVGSACSVLLIPALVIGEGAQQSHTGAVALGMRGADHGSGDGDTEELAQAHEGSRKKHGGGDHAANGKGRDQSRSEHSPGQHDRTGSQLASAPIDPGHDQVGAPPGDAPTRHGGGNGRDQRVRQHQKRDPTHGGKKNHRPGGGSGKGDHEGGHGGGGGSGDEDAITVTYEPSPSVCVALANVCVP